MVFLVLAVLSTWVYQWPVPGALFFAVGLLIPVVAPEGLDTGRHAHETQSPHVRVHPFQALFLGRFVAPDVKVTGIA